MYPNLINECIALKKAWGYDFPAAVFYILMHEKEYPSEIRRELKEFTVQADKLDVGLIGTTTSR